MNAPLTATCLAGGLVVGAAWAPLVPRFAARSGEALEQPRWTLRLTAWPVLAAAGGVAFAAAAVRVGQHVALIPALLLCAILVGVTAIDLRYRIIPNRLIGPGLAIGYAIGVAVAPDRWLELLIATVAGGGVLLIAALVAPGGLGLGDVKLVAMLGAFLGRAAAVAVLSGLLLSVVPSLALLLLHGRSARKMTLALGPFLAAGGVVGLLFGHDLLHWYWHQGR